MGRPKIGCCGIIWYQGQIVAIKCAKGRGYVIPGGKWEKGETFLDAAHREIFEETGLDVNNLKYIWQGRNVDDWHCYIFSGVLTEKPEFDNNKKWKEGEPELINISKLKESEFYPLYQLLFLDHYKIKI